MYFKFSKYHTKASLFEMNVSRNVKRKRKRKSNPFQVYCFEALLLRRSFKDGFISACSGNCKQSGDCCGIFTHSGSNEK